MTQSGVDAPAPEDDLRPIVAGHTHEIKLIHGRLVGLENGYSTLSREVAASRAEAQEWRRNSILRDQSFQGSIDSLTRELSVQNGVQQERNRQSGEKTEALKRVSILLGMICAVLTLISTTLFSSQTFDTAFWGHFRTRPHVEAQINATPNH
ncbi:hypothetical protein HK14_03365 [Acetobacter cibinongensis]|uniref:Uncharacterized protein n=2 Tax=Acetobacter cibinongensis TaxID=146475 RepID=A0A1Z5YW08_9PROT|nr:hypothetical protein HK14_03365 [Acetobacter cibinongensis]